MPDDIRKWDISRTGYKSDAKKIIVHLYEEEGIDLLYVLSQRQAAALLKISQYLEWTTRYDVLPTDIMNKDEFDAWNDQIKERLIVPFEICAKIIDCIENDEDVQAALSAFINDFIQNNTLNGRGEGYPLDTSSRERALALGFNPSCDTDIIWSQALKVVTTSNEAITSFLELLAGADTIPKVLSVLSSLPVIENLGLSSLTDFASLLLTVGIAGYNADYTTTPGTGYEDTLACEIFCSARSTCAISVNDVWTIIKNRITTAIPTFTAPDSLVNAAIYAESWQNWMLALKDYVSDFTTINKADLFFYILWGGLSTANVTIGSEKGQQVFDIALALASDEPSNDWETLCLDCPEPANITLVETYPGTIVNEPAFLYNTPTGGSVWEATYFETAGIALNAQIGGIDVPFNLISASPVTSYQHVKQGEYPTLTTGSGDGASESPLDYLGLLHTGGIVATIEVEPL